MLVHMWGFRAAPCQCLHASGWAVPARTRQVSLLASHTRSVRQAARLALDAVAVTSSACQLRCHHVRLLHRLIYQDSSN